MTGSVKHATKNGSTDDRFNLNLHHSQYFEAHATHSAFCLQMLGASLLALVASPAATPSGTCLPAGARNTPYSQLLGHVPPSTRRLASRSLAALTKAQGNAAAAREQLQQLCQTLQEGHEPEPYWLAGDLSSLALEQGDAEVRLAAGMRSC